MLKLKYKIWKTLEKDLLFAPPSVTPSVEEQKRITQLQLKKINNYKFMTYEMFKSSYSKRTRAIMTINEAVQSVNPSVSVKMAIGIYLFSNALLSLGTERHYKFFEATIWNREILASFALTEVAHGSDARLMCTTASYDPKSREFVVHTPDFKAAKCWVGNLGKILSIFFYCKFSHDPPVSVMIMRYHPANVKVCKLYGCLLLFHVIRIFMTFGMHA